MVFESPRRNIRKYDPDYSKYGFIMADIRLVMLSQCAECGKILSQPNIFFFIFLVINLVTNWFSKNFRHGPYVTKG